MTSRSLLLLSISMTSILMYSQNLYAGESAVFDKQLGEMRKKQGASQNDAHGFIKDASVTALARSFYYQQNQIDGWANDNVNSKNGRKKPNGLAEEWGTSGRLIFESGYTQGLVGLGMNVMGFGAYKLDTGRGRVGLTDFPTRSPGKREPRSYGMARYAAKARVSKTSAIAGFILPSLPVVFYDDDRLNPQVFRGGLLTSHEIEGLELNVGRFTAQNERNQTGQDSVKLNAINVYGGTYHFNDSFNGSYYFGNTEDVYKKKYVNLTYNHEMAHDESINVNFNAYRVNYSTLYTNTDKIEKSLLWSFQPKYTLGHHTFAIGYQQNTGDRGYDFNKGDGGTEFYANAYYSDFNNKDEKSIGLKYFYNFAGWGLPSLNWNPVYVRSHNVDRKGMSKPKEKKLTGRGKSHEFYNNLTFTVPDGALKDLYIRLRHSNFHSNFNKNVDETRIYVEYPMDIL